MAALRRRIGPWPKRALLQAPRDGKLKIHLVFRDAPPPAEKLDAWQHSLLTRVMVVVDRVYPLPTVRVHFEPS